MDKFIKIDKHLAIGLVMLASAFVFGVMVGLGFCVLVGGACYG